MYNSVNLRGEIVQQRLLARVVLTTVRAGNAATRHPTSLLQLVLMNNQLVHHDFQLRYVNS